MGDLAAGSIGTAGGDVAAGAGGEPDQRWSDVDGVFGHAGRDGSHKPGESSASINGAQHGDAPGEAGTGGEEHLHGAKGHGDGRLVGSGPLTDSPPALTASSPASTPLMSPAIMQAVDRERMLPGRRSSSSFSSVHFADAPPTVRQGSGGDSASRISTSDAASDRVVNGDMRAAVTDGKSAGEVSRNGVAPDNRQSSDTIAAHSPTPIYTPSRLSVSRPILRSRSSEGSSRSGHPVVSPSLRDAGRRDSASGTSTPRGPVSRRASGMLLNGAHPNLKRDRSASRSYAEKEADGDLSGPVERLQVKHQRSRTGSLIARGARTSAVTGGYETSSASDTDRDDLVHTNRHHISPTAGKSNAVAGPSRSQRMGSMGAASTSGQGSPTRSFPDFALDTATSLPHGGGSTSFALNRKRAKSLTISSVQGLGSPRRPSRVKPQPEDGDLRHTYGMHTPPLAMERSGSDKSIHRRRQVPTAGLGSRRSSSRDPLRRIGSSPKQIQSALPSLGSASGAASIHATSSLQQGAAIGGGLSSSGVFSRGPSRMPSHHSTLSTHSSSQFVSTAPRTPPGPSRMSSRIPILPTALDDEIPETHSTSTDTPSRVIAPGHIYERDPSPASGTHELAPHHVARHRDKGKQRAGAARRDGLASSLGLAAGGKDAVLTIEQIQHLLSGSDVASALQSVGSGAPLAQSTSMSRTGPTSDSASGRWHGSSAKGAEGERTPNGQPGGEQKREPFLASAPPALTSSTPNDKFSRERTISVSTMGTPVRRGRERDTDDGRGGTPDEPSAGPSQLGHRVIEQSDELRKRTLSNATSSASGPRFDSSINRRRRSTRLSHGESEGHVAFTHFPRPDRATLIESDDEDAAERVSTAHTLESSLNGSSASHMPPASSDRPASLKPPRTPEKTRLTKSISAKNSLRHSLLGPITPDREDKGKDKDKRHRSISAIFHLPGKKRKSESAYSLSHLGNGKGDAAIRVTSNGGPGDGTETEVERDAAERTRREKEEEEAHMRRKEAERREDEESQERYYRALMQVNAHPHAVRLSDRAKVHLWAFYQHVYDGVDDPPRLNPLAVIRWRMRTEEQADRRRDWEAEHGHLPSNDMERLLDGQRSPGSNSLSPMTRPRPLHLSPSPYKPQSLALSDQSRSHSQSHRSLASDSSRGHTSHGLRKSKQSTAQSRWTYSIQDIEEYKAAEGVVRYFIPPPLPTTPARDAKEREDITELTALEHPDEDDGSARQLGDEASSLGGSVGRGAGPGLRFSNEGTSRERVDEMGVITEGQPMPSRNASYLNGSRTSIDMLSRSVSRETDKHGSLRRGHGGGSLRKSHSTSHRHTHSITSKLLAPFERVGELVKEGARRQSTSPYPHGNAHMGGDASDTQDDLSQLHLPRHHRFSPSARNSISINTNPNVSAAGANSLANGLGSRKASKAQIASPEPQSAVAHGHPNSQAATPISANMLRSKTERLFRGRGHGNGNYTDAAGTDDEHMVMPKRGLKSSMASLRKATRGDRVEFVATPTPPMSRAAVGMAKDSGILPDHLQVPAVRSPRAIEKSRAVSDVYVERARQLAAAQRQLLAAEQSLELSSEAGSQYLNEMAMLKQLFHDVADVEMVWPDLDELTAAFAPRPAESDRRLASPTLHGQQPRLGTGHRGSMAPKRGLPHHMRNSNSIGSGSASGSESDHLRMATNRRGSHRQSLSSGNGLARTISNGMHSQRPSRRVDVLAQAREAVTRAEEQYGAMREEQARAENRLRGLLTEIDEIQSQGKEDLVWFQAKLDAIKKEKDTIARLQPKVITWREIIPDFIAAPVFRILMAFVLIWHMAQSWFEILVYHPTRKLLGIRDSTPWRTVVVRVSLLVAFTAVILAYILGGGEGPLEPPPLVKQSAEWGGEVVSWGWRNMRLGWEGMQSRMEQV